MAFSPIRPLGLGGDLVRPSLRVPPGPLRAYLHLWGVYFEVEIRRPSHYQPAGAWPVFLVPSTTSPRAVALPAHLLSPPGGEAHRAWGKGGYDLPAVALPTGQAPAAKGERSAWLHHTPVTLTLSLRSLILCC